MKSRKTHFPQPGCQELNCFDLSKCLINRKMHCPNLQLADILAEFAQTEQIEYFFLHFLTPLKKNRPCFSGKGTFAQACHRHPWMGRALSLQLRHSNIKPPVSPSPWTERGSSACLQSPAIAIESSIPSVLPILMALHLESPAHIFVSTAPKQCQASPAKRCRCMPTGGQGPILKSALLTNYPKTVDAHRGWSNAPVNSYFSSFVREHRSFWMWTGGSQWRFVE